MVRRILAVGLIIVMMLAAGCGVLPAKTDEQTLYNGYMGLTVNVPKGWYVETINEANLTATPEESDSLDDMSIDTDYGDGGYCYDLVQLQNRNLSSNDNHIELLLFAEDYGDVFENLTEYVDACADVYTGDLEDGYYGELEVREEATLNGAAFQKLIINIDHPDNDVPYTEEYYIAEVGGLYLTCYINYWADNMASKQEAYKSLEDAFELDLSKVGGQGGVASL